MKRSSDRKLGDSVLGQVRWPLIVAALGAAVAGCGDTGGERAAEAPAVASEAELGRMRAYLAERFGGESVRHSYVNEAGETIDCVDVGDQPSLREPEMRGHEVRVRPPFSPREAAGGAPDATAREAAPVAVTGTPRCAQGTVPVRRLDLDTLARFRTLEDFHHKDPGHLRGAGAKGTAAEAPCQGTACETHQHGVGLSWTSHRGLESWFDVRTPYVSLSSEFSLSQNWVVATRAGTLETAEAGWQVFRDLYSDWQPHLFIYYTADNYTNTGCYNLGCGFVQVDNTVTIGGAVSGSELDLFWYKYPTDSTGDWWLSVNGTWVGYYPKSKWSSAGLGDYADRLDFGGEIVDKTVGSHTTTDMGRGTFGTSGPASAAYHRNIRYVDLNNGWHYAPSMSTFVEAPACYNARTAYDNGTYFNGGLGPNYHYGTYVLFGGPGYNATTCPQ